MAVLAHLSDPHLGPLPRTPWTALLNKRLSGFLSWQTKRRFLYQEEPRRAILADLRAHAPGHIAVTGDLINLSLRAEYPPALNWLRRLGTAQEVSLVPGNHDCYVPVQPGKKAWAEYMGGDDFPYLRRWGEVALIGVTTAVPMPVFLAAGRMGQDQGERLRRLLRESRGLFRVVMMHHPPYGERRFWRKALHDAAEFRAIVAAEGAELILHGHMHRTMMRTIPAAGKVCPVIGVASCAAVISNHVEPAAYHLYDIARDGSGWLVQTRVRGLAPHQSAVAERGRFTLRIA
ncbi:MAG TPA: metallophosphoesterase [Dongiaceae bacterium]|jgi:3',5'-cyclic AMP phosphodiesterase CpdA|nr:metallophosphoesterase [Dongiaceae bacterium]